MDKRIFLHVASYIYHSISTSSTSFILFLSAKNAFSISLLVELKALSSNADELKISNEIESKFAQFLNMLLASEIDLKLDKSIYFKFLQSRNISFALLTKLQQLESKLVIGVPMHMQVAFVTL